MSMSFEHRPNKVVGSHSAANTDWNQVTFPTGVPTHGPGILVAIKSLNAAGTGDGSLFLVNFGQDTNPPTAATHGFPISGSGQALAIDPGTQLWIKLTASSDTVQILYMF